MMLSTQASGIGKEYNAEGAVMRSRSPGSKRALTRVLYDAPPFPLYSTTCQPVTSVPAGPEISIVSPVSMPELS